MFVSCCDCDCDCGGGGCCCSLFVVCPLLVLGSLSRVVLRCLAFVVVLDLVVAG